MKKTGLFILAGVVVAACSTASAMDRYVAYHDTTLCVNDETFQPGMTAYPVHAWLRMQILGKMQVSLLRDRKEYRLDKAEDAAMAIEPWGFVLSGSVDGLKLKVECFPLIHGNDSKKREGAVVMRIHASGLRASDEFRIDYGGLRRGSFVIPHERMELLSADGFPGTGNNTVRVTDEFVLLASPDVKVVVGVAAKTQKGRIEMGRHPADNLCRINWNPQGGGSQVCDVVAAFAEEEQALNALVSIDPAVEFKKTKAYFNAAAEECVINTPVDSMDEAFKWALLCLEYCYYEPTGWIESIDHWITQYSMMYPRAAEDLGQFERSRKCLLAHAEAIAENGRLRNLDPSGLVRDDFYWNHHFVWDVEHYLDYTGDLETVRKIYPATKRAVEHSFNTYDRDGNLLIGWDQQIGYQEDFVLSPNDGGSASMAGVEMLRMIAKLADKLGYEEDAKAYKAKERMARGNLERELWDTKLGRFIYYQDRYGKKHLDAQYHTFSWPSIYGFGDELGRYTSLRHMHDTLLSPRGLVYVSNNFAGHMAQTTGCQEAAVQTPVAAWALCAGGMREEGANMFEAFGDLVMSDTNKGCYPETAEMPGTYFSPTASFYVEAVIEGLFGIRWADDQTVSIKPGIPDSWDKASIKAKNYSLEYRQEKGMRAIHVALKEAAPVELSWVLPVAGEYTVTVDGDEVSPTFSPAIRGVRMDLKMSAKTDHVVEIAYEDAGVEVACPAELAGGQPFKCAVRNAEIVGVKDPASTLSALRFPRENIFSATLLDGLMDAYNVYGRLGRETFSRRTFFLELVVGGQTAIWPVDFSVAQEPVEVAPETSAAGTSVPLDIPLLNSAEEWQHSRWLDSLPALGLGAIADPLKGLVEKSTPIEGSNRVAFSMEGVGDFEIQPGRMTILSDHTSAPSVTFKVGMKAKALQFLVMPLLNNIDIYSEVAQITVRGAPVPKGNAVGHVDSDLYRKVLHYPGDLDNWTPVASGAGYHSYGKDWTKNPAVSTDTGVFNVVTLEFGKEIDVDSVTISMIGRHPALGIIAVTAKQ